VATPVEEAFRAAALEPQGAVPWGVPVPEPGPGVYVVALTSDAASLEPTLVEAPINLEAVRSLLDLRPELRVDGTRPTPGGLAQRVSGFWLPDEAILYIGLAGTSISKRVGQYHRTPLGAQRPHAGGWFLKLLSNIDSLHVYYASCDDPDAAESAMLGAFVSGVSEGTKEKLLDSERPFPFANLEWPPGTRKRHGITGAKGEDSPRPTRTDTRAVIESGGRTRRASGGGDRMDIEAINAYVQEQLRIQGEGSVTAVEAARWLDNAGLLNDSASRPGLPLRNLMRDGLIKGQRQ
jgi:hypothetical protein